MNFEKNVAQKFEEARDKKKTEQVENTSNLKSSSSICIINLQLVEEMQRNFEYKIRQFLWHNRRKH